MMTRDRQPTTKPKMRGIVSFFSVLLKGKKRGFSDLIHNFHKLVSSQHLCHHCHLDSQKIRSDGRLREEQEEEGNLALQSSVNTADIQVKPSDFNYLKVIGKGSFGQVLLARHRESGVYYAVKVLQKKGIVKRKEQRHVMVERSVLLKGLQHPFLVGLHFSFQTPNALYFVLDYLNGGELFYHLQREGSFHEPRAKFYAAEMASALGYLHSLNIVYRDLKPENVLLDSGGNVMLTDFGLCKEGVAIGGTMQTFCGTPEYSAPEVLRGNFYTPTVDWWSLGCVLFEMLYGLPPFYSRSKAQMYDNILHAPLVLGPGVSRAARSLLKGLLERDCANRIGRNCDFEELQSHPFFLSINWDDLLAKKVTPPFVPSVAGPWDVRYIDPVFTLQPLPASVGFSDRCQEGGATEAFLGFSYIPPVVTEPLPQITTHHKL